MSRYYERGLIQPVDIISDNMSSRLLGEGTYGTVMQESQKAVKYFNQGETEIDCLEDWMREVVIRSVLGVESETCATLAIDGSVLSITMELFSGNLLQEVTKMPQEQVEHFLLDQVLPQIAFQLSMFQQRGLVHLDVTPVNILVRLQEGKCRIALTDFGSCRLAQGSFTPSLAEGWTTKEFIPLCSQAERLDYRYDMYGLGLSLRYAALRTGLTITQLSPQFLQVVERLTGDYSAIPHPSSFPSLSSRRRRESPLLPRSLNSETKRTLANTLFTLTAKKYPSHIVKVCNCISLLLRGSSILPILKELGEGCNTQTQSFIYTFTHIMCDTEAIAAIRTFLAYLAR